MIQHGGCHNSNKKNTNAEMIEQSTALNLYIQIRMQFDITNGNRDFAAVERWLLLLCCCVSSQIDYYIYIDYERNELFMNFIYKMGITFLLFAKSVISICLRMHTLA